MSYIPKEKLEEIRDKADIVKVISNYIDLIPRGRNYLGVCPFHDDNHPSMSVSREKKIYKCFSCGATGTVFNFVMDYENISFPEAVKKVADMTGIPLDINVRSKPKKDNKLYDIFDLSLKYYINNLYTKDGEKAREYLTKRDLNEETIKKFQIGLALRGNGLTNILEKKYQEEDLLKSGLINKNDKGYYDMFYDRIMFPLYDLDGKVVSYSGRIYEKSDKSKYMTTRETEIFKKGQILYNYHNAKRKAREKNQIIVMEGFMDVIRASTIGIDNVIAMMGTAVTKEQANLIKRMGKEVILCFDGDEAGAHATYSSSDEFEKIGVSPLVVRLEDNLDPDEYIRKYGKEKFLRKLEHPISMMDFKLSYLKKDNNLNSSEGEANYINSVISEINKIDDDILREVTIKKLSDESGLDPNVIRAKTKKIDKKVNIKKRIIPKNAVSKVERAEKGLLHYMLVSTDVIDKFNSDITYLPNKEYRMLAREINSFYKENGFINEADFIDYVEGDSDLIKTISDISLENLKDEYTKDQINDYIKAIKVYNYDNEIKRLQGVIREKSDPIEKAKIAQKIVNLKKEVEV